MNIAALSSRFHVRPLETRDIGRIYALCSQNGLYYQYCPPFVTEESIAQDMQALPPRKEAEDKFYLGYFSGERLIAVLDLIRACPDEKTVFIGFFMVDASLQNAGIGSEIIQELCASVKDAGFSRIRLGWARGNTQAEHFWRKNGFAETGLSYDTSLYRVILAQRTL